MKKPLFLKIFSGYLCIIGLLVVCICLFSFSIIKQYHLETLINELTKIGSTLQPVVSPLLSRGAYAELDTRIKKLGGKIDTRITIIDPNGLVLADSEHDPRTMENHKARPEIIQALYGSVGTSKRYSTTLKEDMLYVAMPIMHHNTVSGVVRMSLFFEKDIHPVLHNLRMNIFSTVCIIIIIALVVSFVVSRKLTLPIQKLSAASRRIAAGDFNVRVFLKNSDELYDFANSFNSMTEKIRSLFEEVSFQKEELNNIISTMQEALLVIDAADDRIILSNNSFRRITGTSADISGKFYWEIIRESSFGETIKQVKQSRKDSIAELPYQERIFLCSVSFMPQKGEIVIILHDITEIKMIERMKKDFVVNVSHELRTPLTAIKGFIETMMEEIKDATHVRYLEIIKRHTDRLINIVKDLMVLAKLENEMDIELDSVNIKNILDQVKKTYEKALKEKKLTLKIEKHNGTVPVKGDAAKLEQVFINLVDNAIKYTEDGGILLSIKQNNGYVVITIEDTGIGIPAEHLPRIFERFYVVDKSRSRKGGGTGLGLSIVKHILQSHKGTIDVQSTPGVGTRFTIMLPADPS